MLQLEIYMKEKGWNQTKLAEISEVPQPRISEYLRKKRPFSGKNALKIYWICSKRISLEGLLNPNETTY